MRESILQWIASGVNRVRVNRTFASSDATGPVVVKKRRFGATLVSWIGDLFLRLSGSESRMVVGERDWLKWEAYCLELLYGDRFATVRNQHSLVMRKVDGVTLRHLVENREMLDEAVSLFARELSRAHHIESSYYRSTWSHGDLHLENVLIDRTARRAFLIDFDIRHDRRLPATRRHCDDLKSVLLELISLPNENWHSLTIAFLREYARVDANVLRSLAGQLEVPSGFRRVLWYAKTRCLSVAVIEPRLRQLRTMLETIP